MRSLITLRMCPCFLFATIFFSRSLDASPLVNDAFLFEIIIHQEFFVIVSSNLFDILAKLCESQANELRNQDLASDLFFIRKAHVRMV